MLINVNIITISQLYNQTTLCGTWFLFFFVCRLLNAQEVNKQQSMINGKEDYNHDRQCHNIVPTIDVFYLSLLFTQQHPTIDQQQQHSNGNFTFWSDKDLIYTFAQSGSVLLLLLLLIRYLVFFWSSLTTFTLCPLCMCVCILQNGKQQTAIIAHYRQWTMSVSRNANCVANVCLLTTEPTQPINRPSRCLYVRNDTLHSFEWR